MLFLILSGLPALFIIIFIDSMYYEYLSFGSIYSLEVSLYNFVVTPLNFIRYNINPENTAAHGEHPMYLHVLVNIPLLYNILGVISICSFGQMCYKFCKKEFQDLPRSQSFVALMNSAIFVPILLLSFINHQEARFLIPVTMPLILLHAPKLITGVNCTGFLLESKNKWVKLIGTKVQIKISGKNILKIW